MKKIEAGKIYRTQNGGTVKIYAIGMGRVYPIHGAILEKDDSWIPSAWREDGSSGIYSNNAFDIVIEPLKYDGITTVKYPDAFESSAKIYVPKEFAGLQVEYTLVVVEEPKK